MVLDFKRPGFIEHVEETSLLEMYKGAKQGIAKLAGRFNDGEESPCRSISARSARPNASKLHPAESSGCVQRRISCTWRSMNSP
jgi:hypothetical protein